MDAVSILDTAAPEPIEVTITFLEMDKPPVHKPTLPYNKSIALLRVRHIPKHYYRYLMDRVGRKWHWVNALRLTDEELDGLDREDRDIRVLYLDGAPAGFFDLKPNASGEMDIAYFGMMEHATGQGLGRWFLGAAIDTAWSYKPKRLLVQTCTLDHPAALPLYQKLGFHPTAQKTEMVQPMSFAERAASVMRG